MTNIVITTLRPLENRGVEALGKSIVEGIIRNFADPKITVLTNEPELARRAMPQSCVTFVPDDAFGPRNGVPAHKLILPRIRRYLRRSVMGRKRPVERAFEAADIVLVSGGDVFSSTYGTADRHLWQLEYPIALGKPVLFFAQSIGLFETKAEERSFASRGKRCFFTVREEISQKYLTEQLGVSKDRVQLTADPAFLLKLGDESLLARHGLEGRFACAVVSRGISGFKKLSHEDHVEAWVAAVQVLLERTHKVALIPHVQPSATPNENDLFLAREVKLRLGDDPRVVILDDSSFGSSDFKVALAASEFVVAERTHGAIGAMSMGVPTLSIGYSIKAEGILRQLIRDESLFAKTLVPVDRFTPTNAGRIVAEAWEIREAFAQELAVNLPAAKAKAQMNYEVMRALIGGPQERQPSSAAGSSSLTPAENI